MSTPYIRNFPGGIDELLSDFVSPNIPFLNANAFAAVPDTVLFTNNSAVDQLWVFAPYITNKSSSLGNSMGLTFKWNDGAAQTTAANIATDTANSLAFFPYQPIVLAPGQSFTYAFTNTSTSHAVIAISATKLI